MKQVSKALSLVLCLVLFLSTLVACADVRGTYVRTVGESIETIYEFESTGNTVYLTDRIGSEVYEYELTYELSEDGTEITFYLDDEKLSTEQFEQGEDYIKIGVLKFEKQ